MDIHSIKNLQEEVTPWGGNTDSRKVIKLVAEVKGIKGQTASSLSLIVAFTIL